MFFSSLIAFSCLCCRIVERQFFCERDAALCVKQMLEAVKVNTPLTLPFNPYAAGG